MAKPWWRKRGWSAQGGLLSGVFRAAQRPTGAPGGLAAAWSPVEMVRLQPAPEARAAPPYPRPAASGELPRMGKRRTVGRVSTGQFARSLRRARVQGLLCAFRRSSERVTAGRPVNAQVPAGCSGRPSFGRRLARVGTLIR